MRRHAQKGRSGPSRLANALHVRVLQVADPAVDHLERVRRGGAGEVGPVDQSHGQPALGRVQRSSGTEHPATNDDEIELGTFERGQITLHRQSAASRRGHRGDQLGLRQTAASFLVRILTSLP
jgi:hypothetical protein